MIVERASVQLDSGTLHPGRMPLYMEPVGCTRQQYISSSSGVMESQAWLEALYFVTLYNVPHMDDMRYNCQYLIFALLVQIIGVRA